MLVHTLFCVMFSFMLFKDTAVEETEEVEVDMSLSVIALVAVINRVITHTSGHPAVHRQAVLRPQPLQMILCMLQE